VEIQNPEGRFAFPEVLVEIQRRVWISRGHRAQKGSAAFSYEHKISIYAKMNKTQENNTRVHLSA
jgi:hypothetical protein